MKYVLLQYADASQAPEYTAEQRQAAIRNWKAFQKEMQDAGVLLHNAGLEPVEAATTVRVRNGKTQTTDGPFAATPEQLGGFFLIDCANLDDALFWAAKDPSTKWGSVEIRPVATYRQE